MDSGNRAESLGGNRSDGRERKLLAEKFYHRVEVDHDDQDGGENFHWPEEKKRKSCNLVVNKNNLLSFINRCTVIWSYLVDLDQSDHPQQRLCLFLADNLDDEQW